MRDMLLRMILFAGAVRTVAADDTPEAAAAISALAADDECEAGDTKHCGLNALQFRRQSPVKSVVGPPVWDLGNNSHILDHKSEAPVLTFYMYRAVDDGDYPPTNANLATIGGILWYLHTEVASCELCVDARRGNVTRVARYRVQMRATQPLFLAGVNFGLQHHFEEGKCTGPGNCNKLFAKYGYFVGCHSLSSGLHHPSFAFNYTGAFFSLPGQCPQESRDQKSLDCRQSQPGGLCGEPTGAGTCTWSYKEAGVVSLNELENITDYAAFREKGGQEYSTLTDRGIDMAFWDGRNDPNAGAARVKKLDALFKAKYPDLPLDEELPSPPCDFKRDIFLFEQST